MALLLWLLTVLLTNTKKQYTGTNSLREVIKHIWPLIKEVLLTVTQRYQPGYKAIFRPMDHVVVNNSPLFSINRVNRWIELHKSYRVFKPVLEGCKSYIL